MRTIEPQPQYLSVSTAAIRLAVSAATIRRLVDRGEIPALRVGGQVRIPANFDQHLEHR